MPAMNLIYFLPAKGLKPQSMCSWKNKTQPNSPMLTDNAS